MVSFIGANAIRFFNSIGPILIGLKIFSNCFFPSVDITILPLFIFWCIITDLSGLTSTAKYRKPSRAGIEPFPSPVFFLYPFQGAPNLVVFYFFGNEPARMTLLSLLAKFRIKIIKGELASLNFCSRAADTTFHFVVPQAKQVATAAGTAVGGNRCRFGGCQGGRHTFYFFVKISCDGNLAWKSPDENFQINEVKVQGHKLCGKPRVRIAAIFFAAHG